MKTERIFKLIIKIYLCWHTYVTEFSNYYRKCADLLRSHKNAKTSLHEITLEEFRLYCIPYEVLLGQKLCFSCKSKVFFEKKENENVDMNMKIRMK